MDGFLESLQDSLPSVEIIELRTEADCYGISSMISSSLHLPFTPFSFVNWIHGWVHADLNYIEQFGVISDLKYLVATDEQELFFIANGKDAIAVGVPYIYASDFDTAPVKRHLNSLLVMPPHGIAFSNEGWDELSYIKEIAELKAYFDHIVVCVHHSCLVKGHWVKQFEKYNIPYIEGANMHDKNSLVRMHRIFSSFEYMTTNCMGSHVAYAAYSGCKVSVYGSNYLEWSKEDVGEDELYVKYPFIMDHNLKWGQKKLLIKKFPFLFSHPKEASSLEQWGRRQLGEKHKKTYFALAKYLGWLPHQQIYFWSRRVFLKLKKEIGLFYSENINSK